MNHNSKGQVATQKTSFSYSHLRGQVATEFMLYTAIFMFVAVAAFLVVGDMQKSEVPLQQNKAVKEIGDSFVNIFTLSVKGGEGFSYTYTFPKTVFGIPYQINLNNLIQSNPGSDPKNNIVIEWAGNYGNFSFQYNVPAYKYIIIQDGPCLSGNILTSNSCSNILEFYNDGENLTIKRVQ